MPHPSTLISRPYRDLDDLRAMLALLMDGRALPGTGATGTWASWRLPSFSSRAIWTRAGRCASGTMRDGRLAGYATVGEDPVFDFQVAPGFEGRGIEEQAAGLGRGADRGAASAARGRRMGPAQHQRARR